jgi:hypothetical protein
MDLGYPSINIRWRLLQAPTSPIPVCRSSTDIHILLKLEGKLPYDWRKDRVESSVSYITVTFVGMISSIPVAHCDFDDKKACGRTLIMGWPLLQNKLIIENAAHLPYSGACSDSGSRICSAIADLLRQHDCELCAR